MTEVEMINALARYAKENGVSGEIGRTMFGPETNKKTDLFTLHVYDGGWNYTIIAPGLNVGLAHFNDKVTYLTGDKEILTSLFNQIK